MTDHLKDPQAVSWGDLAEDFAFTDAERTRFRRGRRRWSWPPVCTASPSCGSSSTPHRSRLPKPWVSPRLASHIEKGQLERSEVDTLAAYVKALGGKLKIVADFGDESYVLG